MESVKFSIIIPCHNVAVYLRETLESVLAQSFARWECICIDDGSTDGTNAILDEYGCRDRRFKIIHKKNGGVSVARNDAIKVASGEYICFLDGDDVWTHEWLERMAEATQEGWADIVRMQFIFWRENEGYPRPTCPADCTLTRISGVDQVMVWGWKTYTTGGYIWLNAFRRELLTQNQVEFPVGMRINEDIIFDLSVLPFAKCAVQSSYAGYFYRMRETSAWHSRRPIEACVRYIEECNRLWAANRMHLETLGCATFVRRKQAFTIWGTLLQWLKFGVPEDRVRTNEILGQLKVGWQNGMLTDLTDVPWHWRPGLILAVRCGSLSLLELTLKILLACHKVLRF